MKEKDQYVDKVRQKLNVVKKPLEEVLKKFANTIFASGGNVVFDDITINEQTIDQYLAILEENLNKLMAYKAKVNNEKNVYTTALILEEMPPMKDMDKSRSITGLPQIKDVLFTEENPAGVEKLLDEHSLIELAYEQIEKAKDNFEKKKQALNNSANLAQNVVNQSVNNPKKK